jgi:hypothetical protein
MDERSFPDPEQWIIPGLSASAPLREGDALQPGAGRQKSSIIRSAGERSSRNDLPREVVRPSCAVRFSVGIPCSAMIRLVAAMRCFRKRGRPRVCGWNSRPFHQIPEDPAGYSYRGRKIRGPMRRLPKEPCIDKLVIPARLNGIDNGINMRLSVFMGLLAHDIPDIMFHLCLG